MRDIMLGELQRRLKNRVSMDYLMTFLSRCGTVCSTVLHCGKVVIKWVNYASRVCYGYGKTFRDALVSVSYSAWCA